MFFVRHPVQFKVKMNLVLISIIIHRANPMKLTNKEKNGSPRVVSVATLLLPQSLSESHKGAGDR